jgi:hypothetical protein
MFITDAELAEHRADAEALMVDTCRITRAGVGKGPWNETTMQYDPPDRVTLYEGRCKLALQNAFPVDSSQGSLDWSTAQPALHVPVVGTESVRRGDVAECLTSRYDAANVGRKLTIEAPFRKSIATARRLVCSEGV